ncbi:MAG: hypothetical protein AVW05_03070 [Hadesarchaea archaeon DG-33]|nr:MAG: hypothetical protein AVW05_03070 [Hadesarchaea archaeon DG-33]
MSGAKKFWKVVENSRLFRPPRTFWKDIKKSRLFRLTRTGLIILLAFFVILSLTAIIGVSSAHLLPVEEENVITLSEYQHLGEYDYIAELKPNEIYDNQLTLGPGEGILYFNIVENVAVTFHYTFICDCPASITTEYLVGMDLESPGKWIKHLTMAPQNSVSSNGERLEFSTELFITVPWFEELRTIIDTETGTSSYTYNLRVKPEIHTVAETDVGTIDESIVPELMMSFKYGGDEGNQIVMSGLENSIPGAIQRTETTYYGEVLAYRGIFYVVSAVAFVGLIGTAWGFMRNRSKSPEKLAEKIIEPFKEAVVEVAEEPSYTKRGATIAMKSLEDLVSLAEGLGKPVLYLKKPPHTLSAEQVNIFYVLDDMTRYEYSFKLSNKSDPKA